MILPRIQLDWPAQPLWPNRQKHWRTTRAAQGVHRDAAFYTAKAAGWSRPIFPVHGLHLDLTFCAPSARRYDLDNALAAMKAAIDGLARCIKVDDSLFSYSLQRGEKSKNGGVIVVAEVK